MSTRRPAVTRADVAREAGTSVAVVSYVVNDGPRRVAPETRERVLRAIETVGYTPDPIAKALASGVSGAYALVVPDVSNAFFAELAHRLQEAVAGADKVLLLGDAAESPEREARLLRTFAARRVDGVLVVGVGPRPDLAPLLDAGVPVVVLDRADAAVPVSSVSIDNAAAARAATEHLIGHGHSRIGIVAGPAGLPTAQERARGWRAALEEAGLPARPEWMREAPFTRRGGREAAGELLAGPDAPTALFVSNEQQAVGVLAAAHALGVAVPEDLALFTIDGTDDSEFSAPGISTAVQPLDRMARSAVGLLRPGGAPEHVVHDFALRIRGSCGAHDDAAAPDPLSTPPARPPETR